MKNKRNLSSLTESERPIWKGIDNHFAHADTAGNVTSDIVVFMPGVKQKMFEILQKHEQYKQTAKMVFELFEEVKTILKRYSNPILHEQLNYYVYMLMSDIRMMLINDAVASGQLVVPDHPELSKISMYLEIKNKKPDWPKIHSIIEAIMK